MIRFNTMRLIRFRFGSAHHDAEVPADRLIQDAPHPDLRDGLQTHTLSDYERSFLPDHQNVNKPRSLYNLLSLLNTPAALKLGQLVADNKTILTSDNLYLPRITANGVPIYDSLRGAQQVQGISYLLALSPLFFVATVHYPGLMLVSGAILYLAVYRPTVSRLMTSLVLKMELVPETEEVLIQKVHPFGSVYTTRVKISDLEHVPKKEIESHIFYRFSRSAIESQLLFRIKSTGDLLTFDEKGYWYEEGLNHELMI